MIAKKIILNGRVQGVGFREFARRYASIHRINGFVRNLTTGELEIFAQGADQELSKFIKEIKRGPMLADIKEISCMDADVQEMYKTGFVIEF